MRRQMPASVTVFLAMVFVLMLSLLGGLFESVRAAGAGTYVQTALDASADSVMSRYDRKVFDHYRIFLLEEPTGEIRDQIRKNMLTYLKDAPFYPVYSPELSVSPEVKLTDRDGKPFEDQAAAYMKFAVIPELPKAEEAVEQAKAARSGEQFGELGREFNFSGGDVVRLEEALDRIGESRQKQLDRMAEGDRALDGGDGDGFRASTEELLRELRRMPGLAADYEKKADRLGEQVKKAGESYEKRREDMDDTARAHAEEQLSLYRSYTEAGGAVRESVRESVRKAEKNTETAERALDRADEVEELIERLEEAFDDEDDDADELEARIEALWRSIRSITAGYQKETPWDKGKRDRKKLSLLERMADLTEEGIFHLCLPESDSISSVRADCRNWPSYQREKGSVSGLAPGEGIGFLPTEAIGKILLDEYGMQFFTDYLGGGEARGEIPDGGFTCEKEYLLIGGETDRENLRGTVMRLFALRQGMNLLTILGSSSMKAEARAAAASIVGASGGVLTPLAAVVYGLILTVWSAMESAADVRVLLKNGKVPIMKKSGDWKVSLKGILEQGTGILDNVTMSEKGLNYSEWIRILMLVTGKRELRFRMMDMIQKNRDKLGNSIRLNNGIVRIRAEYSGQGMLIPVKKRTVREY
ncbi:DUF5702 domain-containing protein [[Clostridium] aminophilum]|uniref:Uncharacterized protein n=1 Tax=[Clostridium] aminophilum TaxID=1526 RepID=A0A1I6JW99_9FIRM|nr:DUF5702 domain-containing protein [[Clostridium] aminophilum]SFR83216.1 hypothetical protein SAMN02910262_02014 [[Clostridium] aminophilum]